MRWYNLNDALIDVMNGYEPWSRPGLTRENAQSIVEQEAKTFLEEIGNNGTDPSTSSG
jgi:hypothetical protein